MNLYDLRALYPKAFRKHETWHAGQAFMSTPAPPDDELRMPDEIHTVTNEADVALYTLLPTAVSLAILFVRNPAHALWCSGWFWTSDCDHLGQRVFVGVVGQRFEIHRHLKSDNRNVPVWT